MTNTSPTPTTPLPSVEGLSADQVQTTYPSTHHADANYASVTDFYKAISAKGKLVMQEKRENGERMHLAPLGYKNARDEEGRAILVPDPETYDLVQEAKLMRERGHSIRAICKAMEEKGLRSRQGKVIGPSSMAKIIYCNKLPGDFC